MGYIYDSTYLLRKMKNQTRKNTIKTNQTRKTSMNCLSSYKEISQKDKKKLIYPSTDIITPFGKKKVLYADYIASGKPSPIIENYIIKNIYTKYSNTHSNSNNGICMKNEIKKVREIIKKEYHLNDNYEILFKGSGVTDCINYVIHCIEYSQYSKIHVFISSFEHYSNHLPFVELSKEISSIQLHIIPLQPSNYELDIEWYEKQLSQIATARTKEPILLITSMIHCSNLTGKFTPIKELKEIMYKKTEKSSNITKYVFCDMACSAPYIKEDLSFLDAIFISPHKFIGGVETPGILIAKTCIFQKNHSLHPGGSCVKTTKQNEVIYNDDIEIRESAGTPNIIGIIKIGQCILLRNQYYPIIKHNEKCLSIVMKNWHQYFSTKYQNTYKYISYPDLPIFSFHLTNMHYNFIVVLLNDKYGIQSRGGKVCSGLLNDILKEKEGIDGMCRISLHWIMEKKEIIKIFRAIEDVIQNGELYKKDYKYDSKQNLFSAKNPLRAKRAKRASKKIT